MLLLYRFSQAATDLESHISMGIIRNIVAGFVGCVLMGGNAKACFPPVKFDPSYIEQADIVVTGSVVNFHIVIDLEARAQQDRDDEKRNSFILEKYPQLYKDLFLERITYPSDYARFEIEVDEVLRGTVPPGRLTAFRSGLFHKQRERLGRGPFLIALRNLTPSPGKPSAKIRAMSEPNLLSVVSPACTQDFIFDVTAQRAVEIRSKLEAPEKIVVDWFDLGFP